MQQTLSPSPISEKAVSFLKRTQPLLIDGEWTLGSGSKTLAVFDPASGKQIAESADASADDVNKAVAAARRTFDTRVWLDIDPTERAKILWKIADIIDSRAADMLAAIHDRATGEQLAAERAFLATLDGSCETPIAGLAELNGTEMRLRGQVLRPDGSDAIGDDVTCAISDGAEAGEAMARKLLAEAGPGFFDWRE